MEAHALFFSHGIGHLLGLDVPLQKREPNAKLRWKPLTGKGVRFLIDFAQS